MPIETEKERGRTGGGETARKGTHETAGAEHATPTLFTCAVCSILSVLTQMGATLVIKLNRGQGAGGEYTTSVQ